jgi:hypothetical protein
MTAFFIWVISNSISYWIIEGAVSKIKFYGNFLTPAHFNSIKLSP